MNLDELNSKYRALSPTERVAELYKDFPTEKVLFTSSFGTTAAILLHMITKTNPKQVIHFLDTTYHFPETHEYKNLLEEQLNLNIETILPEDWKNEFTRNDETWKKDPDLCCSINKVEPLDTIKPNFTVWISGLMSDQNTFRNSLNVFEKKNDIIKFYPIIDFKAEDAQQYFEKFALPKHPLEAQGFSSIGCTHCTAKGKGREGRWINKNKSECGLHI
ncbi:MAG: phosphoadenylyl-sulfate reductase [Flavobacteriales bacterium]